MYFLNLTLRVQNLNKLLESPNTKNEHEKIEVIRTITQCLGRYNNNLTANNCGFENDKGVTPMKEEEIEKVELTKVLDEYTIPLYKGSRTTCQLQCFSS